MTIESFPITDHTSWLARRHKDVTASAAACLYGGNIHPFISPFEYYCVKAGLVEGDPEETEAMRRGRLLEPVAVELMREIQPNWTIERGNLYFRDPDRRLGATPDTLVFRPDIKGRGSVQIKSVNPYSFKKNWTGDHGLVEPPLYVAVQASIEAHLIGETWASVAALVIGNGIDLHIIDVPFKPKLISRLEALVRDFWDRVKDQRPYAVDYVRDAEIIKALYADDDGGVIELSVNPRCKRAVELVAQRKALKETEAEGNAAEKARKIIDVELVDILGNAGAGVLPDGRIVEAKTIRRNGYEVKPTSFRTVKVKDGFSNSSSGNRPQRTPRSSNDPF